jgi:hypothetical protein
MPNPRPGEKEKDFINRCVADLIENEGRKPDQAAAICHSIWDKHKKQESGMQDLKHKYTFRTDVARGIQEGNAGVDKENGIIYGFSVITKGEARGHGLEIDDVTLDQVVQLGVKSSIGLKSRFGHPNMSNTAVGTFLGRAKNFRRDNGIVRADLYFDKTAYKTPNGDLAGYVLGLAESDPEAFGSSIVFDGEPEYRLNEDGTRKKDPVTGKDLLPLARITKLWAADVVDDPAANNGMFSAFFSQDVMPSAEMTVFLDKFLSNPDAVEKVISFLERYSQTKEEVTKMELKDLTLEMLKKERADLVDSLIAEAKAENLKAEKERIIAILDTAKAFPGMEALVYEAVKNGETAGALLEKLKNQRLEDLKKKSPASAGPGDDPAKTQAKTHLERAKEYQKQFGGTITEALKATAEKRKQS